MGARGTPSGILRAARLLKLGEQETRPETRRLLGYRELDQLGNVRDGMHRTREWTRLKQQRLERCLTATSGSVTQR